MKLVKMNKGSIKKTLRATAVCCAVAAVGIAPASAFASSGTGTDFTAGSGSGVYGSLDRQHWYNICSTYHNWYPEFDRPTHPCTGADSGLVHRPFDGNNCTWNWGNGNNGGNGGTDGSGSTDDDSDAENPSDTPSETPDNGSDSDNGNSGSGSDDITSKPSEDGSSNGSSNSGQTSAAPSGYASEVFDLVNSQRSANGQSALTYSAEAAKVAQAKAEDMAANNYFSHTSPTYGSAFDMLKANGVSYSSAGENIAKGQTSSSSVMNAWMNSSGHRANILSSSYKSVGVGCAADSSGTLYWVQVFIG